MIEELVSLWQSCCYVLDFVTSVKEEAIDFAAAESTQVVTGDRRELSECWVTFLDSLQFEKDLMKPFHLLLKYPPSLP